MNPATDKLAEKTRRFTKQKTKNKSGTQYREMFWQGREKYVQRYSYDDSQSRPGYDTFSSDHFSWVCSAYLFTTNSSLSGTDTLMQRQKKYIIKPWLKLHINLCESYCLYSQNTTLGLLNYRLHFWLGRSFSHDSLFSHSKISLGYLTWMYLQAGGQSVRLYRWRLFSQCATSSFVPYDQEAGPWPLQRGTAHTDSITEVSGALK